MFDIARLLPSYWLVQATHVAVGGAGWGVRGWLTMAAWSAVLIGFAARVYRHDTSACRKERER